MEAVQGIDRIILFRKLAEATTKTATKLAYQMDHAIGITNEGATADTKDGRVHSPGVPEYDFSIASIMARGDEEVKEIKRSVIRGDVYEFWEIDRVEKGTAENAEKYAAEYYQGRFTSFTPTNTTDGSVEISLNVAVNGIGQEGFATLTEGQAAVVQYAFQDTIVVTPEG